MHPVGLKPITSPPSHYYIWVSVIWAISQWHGNISLQTKTNFLDTTISKNPTKGFFFFLKIISHTPLDSFASNASYLHNIRFLCIFCEQKKYSIGVFSLSNVQLSCTHERKKGHFKRKSNDSFKKVKRKRIK